MGITISLPTFPGSDSELTDESLVHPLRRLRLLPLAAIGLLFLAFPFVARWVHLPIPRSGAAFLIVASLITYGALLAWLAVALPRAGMSWRRLFGGPLKPGRLFEVIALAWMHVSFAANSLILLLVGLYHVAPELTRRLLVERVLSDPWGGAPTPALAAVIVVLAPVVEEILFRGLLLQRFALRWGPGRAVLFTSALFAVLHPYHPLGLFAFSVLLSLLFLKARTLWAPIAAHALANGSLVLIGALAKSRNPDAAAGPNVGMLLTATNMALIGFAFVGGIVLTYAIRRWPKRESGIPYDDGAVLET